MPYIDEDVCCGYDPDDCISKSTDFELLVLEPTVVALAVRHRNDLFAVPDESDHMKS